MLCFTQQFIWIAQLPMAQAGQLLLVAAIAFAAITLICSTYRFHKMIQMSEDQLLTVEDCNDFFFVQVTRYLSKINRSASGFGIIILQFTTGEPDRRKVQEALLADLKNSIRGKTDKACLFRDDCVAAIIDTEPENVPAAVARITEEIRQTASRSSDIAVRAGVSIFPANGITTRAVIDAATDALETADFGGLQPFCIARSPDEQPEKPEENPDAVGELSRQDKHSSIDPLTGVLRPKVIGSYFRKYLAEIRQKKEPATLFCIGISRIDQVIQLHGEIAADDVIAGVSEVLQRLTRDSDLIGRFHRDDFMILAPCSLEQGRMIATRLREAVQKEVISSQGRRLKAVVSIGVAAHPEHGRNLRQLSGGAHRALEVLREWNTTACLVYDPVEHAKKAPHATRR